AQVAPPWGGREPAETALHGDGHVLDHAGRPHMQVRRRQVGRVELVVDARSYEGGADRLDPCFLLALDPDVVAVGDPERLVPGLPGLGRYPGGAAPPLRKGHLGIYVG